MKETELGQILHFLQKIAWPFTTLILMYYFALPLKNLLVALTTAVSERGFKLTSGGIEIPQPLNENALEPIKPPHYYNIINQQNKAETIGTELTDTDTPTNIEEALEKHEKRLVNEIISEIDKFLSEKKADVSSDEVLKGLLCDAYINLYFERSFQKILGSQIKLLLKLRESKEYQLDEKTVEEFFELHRNSTKITYTSWISFLEHSRLIKIKNKKVILRDEGKEFLGYIIERDYNLNKPG